MKNRYIVTLKTLPPGNVTAVANMLAQQFQGRLLGVLRHAVQGFGIAMTEERARALSNNPFVELVEEDEEFDLAAGSNARFDFESVSRHVAASAPSHDAWVGHTLTNNCPWLSQSTAYVCTYSNDDYWHLDLIDNLGVINPSGRWYAYQRTGSNVRAYIVDNGVYYDHPEFDTRVEAGANMTVDPDEADYTQQNEEYPITLDYSPANYPCNQHFSDNNDGAGHGTAVASIVGGTNTGIAKAVRIVPVKVVTCDGRGVKLAIARGLDWVMQDMTGRSGVRAVVNMSLRLDTNATPPYPASQSGPEGSQVCEASSGSSTMVNCVSAIENEINSLIASNIPVVVAAGNDGVDACQTMTPARMGQGGTYATTYHTITVGGTMARPTAGYVNERWDCNKDTVYGCTYNIVHLGVTNSVYSGSSNTGSCVSLWAPAWNFRMAGANGGYRSAGPASSGTSFATPIVTGLVARLFERFPALAATQVYTELANRANARCSDPGNCPAAFDSTGNKKLVFMGNGE